MIEINTSVVPQYVTKWHNINMSEQIKKRIQFSVDKGTAMAAEHIIEVLGLTPASVMSMVYAEIANSGKLPVSIEVSEEEKRWSKMVERIFETTPVKEIKTDEDIEAFFDDDGGY